MCAREGFHGERSKKYLSAQSQELIAWNRSDFCPPLAPHSDLEQVIAAVFLSFHACLQRLISRQDPIPDQMVSIIYLYLSYYFNGDGTWLYACDPHKQQRKSSQVNQLT